MLAGTSGKKAKGNLEGISRTSDDFNLRRDHPCQPVDQSKRLDAIASLGTAAMPGGGTRGRMQAARHAAPALLTWSTFAR